MAFFIMGQKQTFFKKENINIYLYQYRQFIYESRVRKSAFGEINHMEVLFNFSNCFPMIQFKIEIEIIMNFKHKILFVKASFIKYSYQKKTLHVP